MQTLRIALNYTYKSHGLIKDSRIAKTDAMGLDFKFVSCRQISYTGSHFQNKRIHKDQMITSSTQTRDLYEVLEITPDATNTEIREAFFRKAKVCHPDVDSSKEARQEFLKSREAYQILSNTLERHEYDKLILGNDLSGAKRIDGLTEEQEQKAREKAREDQEVFYSTKQEVRKQAHGKSVKWKNEYEWVAKVLDQSGGRNLRHTRDVDRIGRNSDKPIVKPKYTIFLEKHLLNHGDLDSKEAKTRNLRTLGALVAFLSIGFGSRLML